MLTPCSSGHSGRFGHEFLGMEEFEQCKVIVIDTNLEFDFRALGDGRSSVVRYANNSQYRNDSLIRKESMFTTSLACDMLIISVVSVCQPCRNTGNQENGKGERNHERRRHEMASEEQRWPTRTRDQAR